MGHAPLIVTGLVGVIATVAGLVVMQSSAVAFTFGGAVEGVASQLGTTFPAAVSVGLATVMELAAGAVIVRLIRWSPYGSIAEAILGGLIGAVAKDVVLLLALGGVGHFGPLPLALIDIALIAAGFVMRPFLELGEPGQRSGSLLAWILPISLWSIPVILQLASPVVPFLDVLPNHVAPIEHVRSFASWDSLAVAPSPIYGPSRIFLGYVALLGSLTTLTGLPATLAVAAFVLPLSVLLAAAGYHLCRVLAGPSAAYWSLLTVPLTFTFLRLPDARATVLAFPLAAAAIVLSIPERRDQARPIDLAGRSRPVLLAAALGCAILVHPVIGALAAATCGVLAIAQGDQLRRAIFAGLGGAALAAAPQAALMAGVSAPAWIAAPVLPLGLLVAAWLGGPGPRRGELAGSLSPSMALGMGWVVLGAIVVVGAIAATVMLLLQLDPAIPRKLAESAASTVADYPVLLLALALGVVMAREARAWLVIGIGALVGMAAMGIANLTPTETRLGESIHFEVPKSVGYWAPWVVALAGGIGLGAVWSREAWPSIVRMGVAATFVVIAALPFRIESLEPLGIEEHRYSEAAAIVLHEAER
ncbi:MAG: hypothetical protein H0V04_00525, partial [Chloroflexi bacterium]|nr:hypothetical protein [Chloroflexota bacterium]